jgi:hypothetical protein
VTAALRSLILSRRTAAGLTTAGMTTTTRSRRTANQGRTRSLQTRRRMWLSSMRRRRSSRTLSFLIR